ncbi:Glycosyltransferase [Musa troglodytarum]|uniref:Glycosyltransferase n=1 Tax=Musa troglodytarum TaxID=320322 RepID=A0A9E7L242_9LILI|nr:Glycosyltransferase [Musa troglodytarum]
MVNQMKLFRNAGQSQRFRFVVLVIGCFLVSMTFIVVSRPLAFPSLSSRLRPQKSDAEREKAADTSSYSAPSAEKKKEENLQGKKNHTIVDPIEEDKTGIGEVMETTVEAEEERADQDEDHNRMTLPTVSNYTIDDPVQVDKKTTPEQPAREAKAVEKMLSCEFSDPRVDICEMSGDIRIPGNSSDVIFVESPQRDQAFRLRPYARKGDQTAFGRVRELTVKSSTAAPQCTVSHDVPAVVFSTGGYTGNLFHDFTDVLIPLFLAARQYDGEVQFVVSDMNSWWVYRYRLLFQKLSKYPPIDFDKDKGVHCFRVVVGLRAHKELSIDPPGLPMATPWSTSVNL